MYTISKGSFVVHGQPERKQVPYTLYNIKQQARDDCHSKYFTDHNIINHWGVLKETKSATTNIFRNFLFSF